MSRNFEKAAGERADKRRRAAKAAGVAEDGAAKGQVPKQPTKDGAVTYRGACIRRTTCKEAEVFKVHIPRRVADKEYSVVVKVGKGSGADAFNHCITYVDDRVS